MAVHLEDSSASPRTLLFQQQNANNTILALITEIQSRARPIPERVLATLKPRVLSAMAKGSPGSEYLKQQLSEAFCAALGIDVPIKASMEIAAPKIAVSTKPIELKAADESAKEPPEEVKWRCC